MNPKTFYNKLSLTIDQVEKQRKESRDTNTYIYRDGIMKGLLTAEVIFTNWLKEQEKRTNIKKEVNHE